MMAALVAGQRDPKVLAQLARGRMRAKITALEDAFTGHFTDHHAFLLDRMLARVDAIDADIAAIDAKIEELITPFAAAVDQLDEVDGVGRTAAACVIAEIGTDMTRFPAPSHLASWAKYAPGVKEISREEERQKHHRARQPLPGPRPGRGRDRRRPHRFLPRRTLPADRPPPRQEQSQRRRRPLPPGDLLAPAV
jgi:transposase